MIAFRFSLGIKFTARITLALVCAASLWPLPGAAAAGNRLNFVFILMDDLGWADVGCNNGRAFYRTPNIDRLAAQGMKFTDGYAACQVCSPTRASIMTGKYPARLHLTDWLPGRTDRPDQKLLRPLINQQLPLEEVTIAEALKKAGYTTGAIGKWHLGGEGFLPQNQGFDVNIGGNHAGSPPTYFYPYKNAVKSIPGLEKGQPGEYLTDRLTTEAEKFIESNKDKPFFLYLAHYAVHIPLGAKKEVIQKYLSTPATGPQTNAIYAAMVESMDDSVGRILKKLDELKLADNTVVFFTGDNGGLSVKEGPNTPATSNAPLRDGKGYMYEGGIREPWIIRWPGKVKAGSVSSTPICTVDVFPTVLEMAGLKPEAGQILDGVSIVPLLEQKGALKRPALYWHYPHYSNQGGKPAAAIREGDFKLIEFYEDGHLELYNVREDIGETKDLAGAMPELTKKLEARLDAWRRDVGAQMMLPNPDYKPPRQSGSMARPPRHEAFAALAD